MAGIPAGAISMPQGKGSLFHNRREFDRYKNGVPDNIDQSRTAENIVVIDRRLEDVYADTFGPAIEAYNATQKRAERRIDGAAGYMEKIRTSKNHEKLFYEDIMQWGKKEDFEQHPELRETAKAALLDYARDFQKNNPRLAVVGIYLHMDEASPHLHIDYVPTAGGYKKGIACRNSLDRAMRQMGYKSVSATENATKAWKDAQRAAFGEICRAHGLEVSPETPTERRNLTVPEYKQLKDDIADLSQDIKQKDASYAELISAGETVLSNQREELHSIAARAAEAEERARIATAPALKAPGSPRSPLFHPDQVIIDREQYDALLRAAGQLVQAKKDAEKAAKERRAVKKMREAAEKDRKAAEQAREAAERDRERIFEEAREKAIDDARSEAARIIADAEEKAHNLDLNLKIGELKIALSEYKRFESRHPEFFKQMRQEERREKSHNRDHSISH